MNFIPKFMIKSSQTEAKFNLLSTASKMRMAMSNYRAGRAGASLYRLFTGSVLLSGLCSGLNGLFCDSAAALPGQPIADVATWMQSNPTIQPAPGETLLVNRTDSPSRRFSFQASVTAPGRALARDDRGIIRSESISLFDTVYGISQARLEESLGFIYGDAIYRDYETAEPILTFPTPEMLSRAEERNQPLLRLTKGELRQGEQFAYWVELVETPTGRSQAGRMTVLLLEDLPKLVAEIERR
jgi:hypothetical protein